MQFCLILKWETFKIYHVKFHVYKDVWPVALLKLLTHSGRGHLNCLNARYRGF